MNSLEIVLGDRYQVYIKAGMYDNDRMYKEVKSISRQCVIIADANVSELYGTKIKENLQKVGVEVSQFKFDAAEKNKTRDQKRIIEDYMLSKNYGRNVCMIALGGGITTDIAGFVAATYYRGIPIIYCPTTLLAMTGACIGGKTAVNVVQGKNLIGAFYHPKAIYMDINVLHDLPAHEFKCALVEVLIKALIADAELYKILCFNLQNILSIDKDIITNLIYRSCMIKKKVIEQDEKDYGYRNILNFAHTVGHAIEACSDYNISHGEAVACGILVELHMAMQLNLFSQNQFEQIQSFLSSIDMPPKLNKKLTADEIINTIKFDKKAVCGSPKFVLLKGIGRVLQQDGKYVFAVPEKIVKKGLNYLLSYCRCS